VRERLREGQSRARRPAAGTMTARCSYYYYYRYSLVHKIRTLWYTIYGNNSVRWNVNDGAKLHEEVLVAQFRYLLQRTNRKRIVPSPSVVTAFSNQGQYRNYYYCSTIFFSIKKG